MNVDYTAADGGAKLQRLRTLIERSKIYTSILADKLLKQQAEARERGEELDRQRRLDDNKAKKEAAIAAGPTRKSSRTAAAVAQKAPHEAEQHVSPTKKAKATTAKAKRGSGKMNIADYFNKKDLDTGLSTKEALKQAQKEELEDVGVTAVTKPSASARQPDLVTGCVLRDYQAPRPFCTLANSGKLAGLEWLISLYENGLNGILADEMGLGKTIQTIAFLAFLRSKGTYGPFLVAAPLSTLSNWINEITTYPPPFHKATPSDVVRCTPAIPCLLYHGDKATREALRKKNFSIKYNSEQFPIVVTSYEIIMADRQFLSGIPWKFIIIDEGPRSLPLFSYYEFVS